MDLTGSYLEKMRYLTDDDFLILDDIGSSGINDWRKEVLFDFLDSRYETGLPTFLTSNLKRKEIREGFGERFESRLFASENTIYELNGPDWRQSMDQS